MGETKQTRVHEWLLRENVATLEEITLFLERINNAYTNKYTYDKVIAPLMKKGKVDRIRRALYTAFDPVTGNPVADPYIVASKIRDEYYLGYHTALEYYGAAYSAKNQIHLCVKPRKKFRRFDYNGITYTPIYTGDTETNIEVVNYIGHHIRICGKERLLIECVDSPQYVGGWEQVLKSLQDLGGINYELIPTLLEYIDIQILTRKTGYILQLLNENSIYHEHLPEKILNQISEKVEGQPEYLIRDEKGNLNETWKLYIPDNFEEKLRGI